LSDQETTWAGWQWQGVLSLFSDLLVSNTRPDGMSFATCITANGNASFWERSLELFHEMQRKLRADVVSFSSIINACVLDVENIVYKFFLLKKF
jgi:hypothetical protein